MGLDSRIQTMECRHLNDVYILLTEKEGKIYGICTLAREAQSSSRFLQTTEERLKELGCPSSQNGIFSKGCPYNSGGYTEL